MKKIIYGIAITFAAIGIHAAESILPDHVFRDGSGRVLKDTSLQWLPSVSSPASASAAGPLKEELPKSAHLDEDDTKHTVFALTFYMQRSGRFPFALIKAYEKPENRSDLRELCLILDERKRKDKHPSFLKDLIEGAVLPPERVVDYAYWASTKPCFETLQRYRKVGISPNNPYTRIAFHVGEIAHRLDWTPHVQAETTAALLRVLQSISKLVDTELVTE